MRVNKCQSLAIELFFITFCENRRGCFVKTKEERIQQALDLTIREFLKDYRTVKEFSEELKYEGSSWVRDKAKKYDLGILGGEIGFHGAGVSTRYLSPEEQNFLKNILDNPLPAGRKPKVKKK
jgi:hypothetical protein